MPWKNTGSKTKPPTPAQCDTEFLFLTEINSLALANAQLNLNKTYQNFFPRAKQKIGKVGFPKWKNRKNPVQSYTTSDQKGSVTIFDGSYLQLPKFKTPIKIKLHRSFDEIIKSVTISQIPSGKYYASILVDDALIEVILIQ